MCECWLFGQIIFSCSLEKNEFDECVARDQALNDCSNWVLRPSIFQDTNASSRLEILVHLGTWSAFRWLSSETFILLFSVLFLDDCQTENFLLSLRFPFHGLLDELIQISFRFTDSSQHICLDLVFLLQKFQIDYEPNQFLLLIICLSLDSESCMFANLGCFESISLWSWPRSKHCSQLLRLWFFAWVRLSFKEFWICAA